jgi:hypothetical protein
VSIVLQSLPGIQDWTSRDGMRRKITVSIYERIKCGAKWRRRKVAIPPLKAVGTLYLENDRQGIFQLTWYEARHFLRQFQTELSESILQVLSELLRIAPILEINHEVIGEPRQACLSLRRRPHTQSPFFEEGPGSFVSQFDGHRSGTLSAFNLACANR